MKISRALTSLRRQSQSRRRTRKVRKTFGNRCKSPLRNWQLKMCEESTKRKTTLCSRSKSLKCCGWRQSFVDSRVLHFQARKSHRSLIKTIFSSAKTFVRDHHSVQAILSLSRRLRKKRRWKKNRWTNRVRSKVGSTSTSFSWRDWRTTQTAGH